MEGTFLYFRAITLTSLESNHVGHKLQNIRVSLNLKQCHVADKTARCISTISDLERYGKNPKFNTVQDYVKALGAELCVLVPVNTPEEDKTLASSEVLLAQVTPDGLLKIKKSA